MKNTKSICFRNLLIIALLFLITLILVPNTVFAKEGTESFKLSKKKLTLYAGNEYKLNLIDIEKDNAFQKVIARHEEFLESDGHYWHYDSDYYDALWEYTDYQETLNSSCKWTSSKVSVAKVNNSGTISVIGEGTTTITCEYKGKKYKCTVKVKPPKYVLNKHEAKAKTNKSLKLNIYHDKKVKYYQYTIYSLDENEIPIEDFLAYDIMQVNINDSNGEIEIIPQKQGKYKVEISTYTGDLDNELRHVDNIIIDVALYGIQERTLGCAIDAKIPLTFGGLSDYYFYSNDENIATVNNEGIVTGINLGDTTITMTGKNKQGQTERFEVIVEVTDPKVTLYDDVYRVGHQIYAHISGESYYGINKFLSSDENIAISHYSLWYANSEGEAKLTAIIDGREFSFNVEIIDPRLETDNYVLAKSGTKQVKVLGLSKKMKDADIKYEIENKKLATVSKDGIIKAKKTGCTSITVTVGDITIKAGVSIGKKKAVKAVESGFLVLGASYSQEKRMQEGYYDCSSFVWRSYAKAGEYLAQKNYAPTAAGLAQNMEENNKVIGNSLEEDIKLEPGDLIFYGGDSNGRYLGINHVAMVMGTVPNENYYYDYFEFLPYSIKIIHAASGGVKLSYAPEKYGQIVMIARPCK